MLVCAFAALVPAAQARNIYVTHYGTPGGSLIRSMSIGADGTPTGLTTTQTPGKRSSGAVMSADGRFLYVVNSLNAALNSYRVEGDGSLTPIGQSDTNSVFGGTGLALSPDGKHVYVALDFSTSPGTGGSVVRLDIGADGKASQTSSSTATGANDAFGIAITPDNKHAYVTNEGTNDITGFNIAADGALTKVADYDLPAGASKPQGIVISPNGTRVYTANKASGNISVFTISPEGVLAAQGNSTATGGSITAILISPDGQRMFAEEQGMGQKVYAFNVNGDGTLTAAGAGVTAGGALGAYPALAITPDSRFLYGNTSALSFFGRLASFAVQPGGGLVALAGSPFDTVGQSQFFYSLVIAPNQGPTASFSSKSVSNPGHVVFDASASTDSDGSIVRYDWDFGDGQTATNAGPNPSHDYQQPGSYTARLTLADNEGCSSTTIYTGQFASCNGANASLSKAVGVLGVKLTAKSQKLSAKGIKLDAECVGEACALDLATSVKLPKAKKKKKSKTVKFKSISGQALAAGKSTTITIGLSKASYRALTKALRKSRSLTATVKATAAADGIKTTSTARVKITKPAKKSKRKKR